MDNMSELVRGGTLCLSKAGLHKGTTTTLDIAAPNGAGVDFCIGGKMYHKADTNTIATTACAQQAAAVQRGQKGAHQAPVEVVFGDCGHGLIFNYA